MFLAVYQLIDISIVFDLELFWTMPPRNYWTHTFCMDTLSFLLDRHLGVDLMSINKVSLTFLETDQLFSKAPLPFYFSKSELHRHQFIFIVINTGQCRFSFILGEYTTSRCIPLANDVEKTYRSFAYFSGIMHIQICCLFIHWVLYLLTEFSKSLYILDMFLMKSVFPK